MSQHTIPCKNCGSLFTGHFCNNCGQRSNTHRIDLKHLFHEFFHALTHLDKGFLYTLKCMISHPGSTVRDYIEGKRIRHPNPYLMLLIIGGLSSLTYYNLELSLPNSFKINELDGGLHAIDSKFFALLYTAYSLLLSLVNFILFRYKKYNFTELFTLNIFISNLILAVLLLLVPVWLLGRALNINTELRLFFGSLFLIYVYMAHYDFFEASKDKKSRSRMYIEAVFLLGLYLVFSWKSLMSLAG